MTSKAEARRVTDNIKKTAISSAKQLAQLLIDAVKLDAYNALGYETCAEYFINELKEIPLRLNKEDRAEVFESMYSRGGMSLREIAKVTGYSKDTVARALSVSNETPPDPIPLAQRLARTIARLTEVGLGGIHSRDAFEEALRAAVTAESDLGDFIKALHDLRDEESELWATTTGDTAA